MNGPQTKRQSKSSVTGRHPWLSGALVAASAGLLLLGCSKKQAGSAPPKGTADLSGAPVYGWTICPKWGALVYSDGRDLIWQDRQTGRRVNLTAPLASAALPKDMKKAVLAHESKLPAGQQRQAGSELYPACSPDGGLLAFAAVRKNDNDDQSDDADSDIWAIRLNAQLVDDLRAGRSLSQDKGMPIYFGPLQFVQLTNLPKIQETMPSFNAKGDSLLFLGRHNHLWEKPLSHR